MIEMYTFRGKKRKNDLSEATVLPYTSKYILFLNSTNRKEISAPKDKKSNYFKKDFIGLKRKKHKLAILQFWSVQMCRISELSINFFHKNPKFCFKKIILCRCNVIFGGQRIKKKKKRHWSDTVIF
jgi:hypothetical protein